MMLPPVLANKMLGVGMIGLNALSSFILFIASCVATGTRNPCHADCSPLAFSGQWGFVFVTFSLAQMAFWGFLGFMWLMRPQSRTILEQSLNASVWQIIINFILALIIGGYKAEYFNGGFTATLNCMIAAFSLTIIFTTGLLVNIFATISSMPTSLDGTGSEDGTAISSPYTAPSDAYAPNTTTTTTTNNAYVSPGYQPYEPNTGGYQAP